MLLLTAGLFTGMLYSCEQEINNPPLQQEASLVLKQGQDANAIVLKDAERTINIHSQRYDGTTPY